MPRVKAFSPASAQTRSSQFDMFDDENSAPAQMLSTLRQLKLHSPLPRAPVKASVRRKGDVGERKVTYVPLPNFEEPDPEIIGAFRMIVSVPAKQQAMWACRASSRRPNPAWTIHLHQLPLETIACYLTLAEFCGPVLATCRAWRAKFARETVWRMLYARKSHPQVFSRRSFATSWKTLCQGGARMSVTAQMDLRPGAVYFDFGPAQPTPFSPSQVNAILGHARSPVISCLEILPGFFWAVLQTVVGFVQVGVLTRDGVTVPERGLDVATRYFQSLSPGGWKSMNVRSIVLLLTALQAVPGNVPAGAALNHSGTFLVRNPFRLVLRYPRDAPVEHYFFGCPRQVTERRALLQPDSKMGAKIDSAAEPLSEITPSRNMQPDGHDAFATLQVDPQTQRLVWSARCP